jgi:prepilin-type N-terminal cleavage/methylation domain-containing protein
MKKLTKKGGFSLIEMMCALLIMVLLIMAIDVGLKAGGEIYQDATFEAESGTLAGILNTSLGDILRYSSHVKQLNAQDQMDNGLSSDVEFVFTSIDYGIQDAYFYTPPHESGGYMGTLQMKNLRNAKTVELVNSGAYPDLVISDFVIKYKPRTSPGIEGGYYTITYTIYSESDLTKTREVETIVRQMND